MAGTTSGLSSFLATKPDYASQGAQSIQNSAQEIVARIEGNTMRQNAEIKKRAAIESAQATGQANSAVTSAQSNLNMTGNIAQGVQGLASFIPSGGLFNKAGSGLSPAM